MVEFKLNIADPKTGKCYQRAVTEPATDTFIGLKIGDKIKGDNFELSGYEFEITGGSDFCGFPMRKGISGERKRILAEKGVGFRKRVRGMKKRKSVCGNAITKKIIQINLKVLKAGKAGLGGAEEKKEEAPKEEKKEAKPKAEKKEAPKEEKPKEEGKEAAPAPKEEKPAEEKPKKEEAPKEEKKE
jgi:small subunit ribosomal protein S6e